VKKIIYILKSLIIDLRENGQLILFSAVLAFVGLFFLADLEKIKEDIYIFSSMQGAYFLSVNNQELTEKQLREIEKDQGFLLHNVEYMAVNIDGNYAECYLYDDYIIKHLNYNFCKGSMMKNENEVILSYAYKDKYEVGDSILLAGYDKNNNLIEKEKTVCGILKDDIIYYPHGTGDKVYNLLMIDVGDTDNSLYYSDVVLCADEDFSNQSYINSKATYMLELLNLTDVAELKSNIADVGYLYSGEELINQNELTLQYESNQKKVFFIAGLTLGLSVFMGCIYISIIRRKKEFGILMLSGATFKNALIMMRIPGVFSILIGIVLGEYVVNRLMDVGVLDGKCYFHQMVWVFGGIFFIYIICCFVLELVWNKKTIIDLIERR